MKYKLSNWNHCAASSFFCDTHHQNTANKPKYPKNILNCCPSTHGESVQQKYHIALSKHNWHTIPHDPQMMRLCLWPELPRARQICVNRGHEPAIFWAACTKRSVHAAHAQVKPIELTAGNRERARNTYLCIFVVRARVAFWWIVRVRRIVWIFYAHTAVWYARLKSGARMRGMCPTNKSARHIICCSEARVV